MSKSTEMFLEKQIDYVGLDFNSQGENDIWNYNLLESCLNAHGLTLNEEDFKLNSHKGMIWWGDDYDTCLKEFGGWSSKDIMKWIGTTIAEVKRIEEIELPIKPKLKQIVVVNRLITRQQRYDVLKRQKWRCNQCAEVLKFNSKSDWDGKVAHIDHIHPYSKRKTYPNGAENINECCNLQGLCPDCNLKKGKKEIH